MTELLFVFAIFSVSFIVLFWGIKDSPRSRLLTLYVKKKDLSEKAKSRGDFEEYRKLREESRVAYEMVRRLDEPFCNDGMRRW